MVNEEEQQSTDTQEETPAPAKPKRKSAPKKPAKKKAPKKAPKKPAKKKAGKGKPGAPKGAGYKGHREGSRKEKAHKLFDQQTRDTALKNIVALGIKRTTALAWFSQWGGSSRKKAA